MDETSKQIVIAVAAASAAALASGLISHYLTKSSIASGATPLPAGSTPTTTSGVIVATPKTSADQAAQQSPGTTAADANATATPAPPPPAPQITPQQLQNAVYVAKAVTVPTYSYNAPSVPQSAWTPKNVNP